MTVIHCNALPLRKWQKRKAYILEPGRKRRACIFQSLCQESEVKVHLLSYLTTLRMQMRRELQRVCFTVPKTGAKSRPKMIALFVTEDEECRYASTRYSN